MRPTPVRVREALFNMLGAAFVRDARMLELFAGSGVMGMEALSRGAAQVCSVERDNATLKLLGENLALCGFADQARLVRGSAVAESVLRQTLSAAPEGFDLLFLDPPYGQGLAQQAVDLVARLNLLRDGAVAVAEHERGASVLAPSPAWRLWQTREYGQTAVTLWCVGRENSDLESSPDHE
ncbi:putative 16S rRNA (guanine966-N2)-methyltransferase [Magnetofaba australis IT-1]|uniref:Putative 16S rRNA (Guanine966-N2)-methyltransferase n=1 Tax=Magnetofaba australis IT-1 TaxID=1434232 RepID=A0A1Y2K644_9PROT|nr:putative 16S rRNA (guanine966-N2)-methyltransferase [Magnetofaba australis IT-1]